MGIYIAPTTYKHTIKQVIGKRKSGYINLILIVVSKATVIKITTLNKVVIFIYHK